MPAPGRTSKLRNLLPAPGSFPGLLAAAATLALLAAAGAPPALARPGAEGESAFVEPPGEESPAVGKLIDRAEEALRGGAGPSSLLADGAYMEAHPYPRFRDLIRRHAPVGTITLVTPDEAGEPLIARGTVLDAGGAPVAGALVYAYQTSAKGLYAERAGHVSGMAGDQRHARLFGYVKTDASGRFELRTIRPAGYPHSNLPAHIHVQIAPPGTDRYAVVSEIRFEDDPRMTPEETKRSREAGWAVVAPRREAGGVAAAEARFALDTSAR